MRITICSAILVIGCAFLFSIAANAQTDSIKVKFEIDGKESHQPFRILLSANGASFEPPIIDNSFTFPPELRSHEKVGVRFICGKYDLNYGEVNLSKFSGEMIFGIDKKPFAEENLPTEPPPDKELVGIYYIRFEPDKGAATMLVVHEYR